LSTGSSTPIAFFSAGHGLDAAGCGEFRFAESSAYDEGKMNGAIG